MWCSPLPSCSTDFDGDFSEVTDKYIAEIEKESKNLPVPFYPNISVGWDNNVRFNNFMPGVVKNNTPENFKKGLEMAKEYADKYNDVPLITINSWNEWTEMSYLEPDDVYGYGYLEAIRRVFCGHAPTGTP